MSFQASTTGARLLGGLSGANYLGESSMGNAYLRAKSRLENARLGADSIEQQSKTAADSINRNATRNMFGQIAGGLISGVGSGLTQMNQTPKADSSKGFGQYAIDPGFDTRIDLGIAPGSPGSFNPGAFTYF